MDVYLVLSSRATPRYFTDFTNISHFYLENITIKVLSIPNDFHDPIIFCTKVIKTNFVD